MKKPRYIEVDGLRVDNCFIPENVRSAMNFLPRSDDVIVATYPKCGTTWMCHIVILILRRGKEPLTKEEYFSCCPFLELLGEECAEKMDRPGCIKTHLPFDRTKFSKEAKYIYVARHPRDCVVSFYHHTKFFPNYYFSDGTFDEFFEVFIRGETDFNDYFDNLLSWYEHRDEPNVFFTTFEDMKADHRGTVVRVAEFLGEEHLLAVADNNGHLLDAIVRLSAIENMKKVTNDILTEAFLSIPEDLSSCSGAIKMSYLNMKKAVDDGETSIGNFIRDGKVGDGKTVLSEEQERRLQERIREKTRCTDVMSLWPSENI